MSDSSKEKLNRTKETFKKVGELAEEHAKQSDAADKQLAEKLRKAGESAKEVVKHIEKRSG